MARVLVVDDEKSIRVTLREFLAKAGYEADMAEDAQEAQRSLASGVFDVVVSDIILPGMTGVDLLRFIRQAAPQVQVILMTGEPNVGTASEAVRAGAFDYLCKPIGKEAILRSVGNAVKIKVVDDERRRLAELSGEYQKTLERQVAERTRSLELSNEQLKAALGELEETQAHLVKQERLKALGQMASGIAHDFNNLLVPILGFSELMVRDPDILKDPKEAHELLSAIYVAATDGRELVKRLREFYRPDERVEAEDVDLLKLIGEALTLTEPRWKPQARAKGGAITVRTDLGKIPRILCNRSQIREVLTNLIFNAADAMPHGGTLTLQAEAEADGVVLRICDTGTGMHPDVLAHCFEPFFTTKGKRGTGLGLSMVYGVIQRHGGKVEVQSEVGRGTTVSVHLLRRAKEVAQAVEPAAAERTKRKLRVLIIDDEPWVLTLVGRYLRGAGHGVETAGTGGAGLQRLAGGGIDLIITDRAMPDMSGDEVAKAAKAATPAIPVIMLTGFGQIMKDEGETPEGVDLVLGKPMTGEELEAAIGRVMP